MVAALLGGVACTPATPASVAAPKAGVEVFVNTPGAIDANNTPTIVRNPRRPSTLVVVHRVDRPRFSGTLRWSQDDGATWGSTALPLPSGKDRPFHPDAAFGPDGVLYVVYGNLTGPRNMGDGIWVATSTDGGRTLTEPVRVAAARSFQPRIAVSRGGMVHVTWLAGRGVSVLKLVDPPSPIVTARSTDGGRTFGKPVQVSDLTRARVGAGKPFIDGRGDLAVLYIDYKNDRRDFEDEPGPPSDERFALVLTRSGDGGKTFDRGVEIERDVVPARRFLAFVPEYADLAVGPDKAMYAVWSSRLDGDEDVYLRKSTDNGETWSEAVRVGAAMDNTAADKSSQYLPSVDVAPDGRVDVLYLDRARDPRDVLADATLATSYDDGQTFQVVRLSSKSFDSTVGSSVSPNLPADFGSRLALLSETGRAVAAWTDTRMGNADTGRQDIALVRITLAEKRAGRGPLWSVGAGVAAAALAALVGTLILRRRRRRGRVAR